MASTNTQEVCVDCWPDHQHGESAPVPPVSSELPEIESFQPPSPESLRPSITIEFCDRCRWAPRATWVQTELFLTFQTPLLKSITLQPLTSPETGGRFRVWLYHGDKVHLVWDRKTEGGFPELKVLKQRLRNILQPEMSLGHSDKPGKPVIGSQMGRTVPPTEEELAQRDHSSMPPDAREVLDLIDRVKSNKATFPEAFKLMSLRP